MIGVLEYALWGVVCTLFERSSSSRIDSNPFRLWKTAAEISTPFNSLICVRGFISKSWSNSKSWSGSNRKEQEQEQTPEQEMQQEQEQKPAEEQVQEQHPSCLCFVTVGGGTFNLDGKVLLMMI